MADKANIRNIKTKDIEEMDIFADANKDLAGTGLRYECSCGAVFLDKPVVRNLKKADRDYSDKTIFYTLARGEKHAEGCINDKSSKNPIWNNKFARNTELYDLDEIIKKIETSAKRKTSKDKRSIPTEVLEILPEEFVENNKMKDGYLLYYKKEKISSSNLPDNSNDATTTPQVNNTNKDYSLTVEIRDIDTGETIKTLETAISKEVKIPRNKVQRITLGASSLHLYAASVLVIGNKTIRFGSGEPVLDHIVFFKNYLDFRCGEKDLATWLTMVTRRIHLSDEEKEKITDLIKGKIKKPASLIFQADAYLDDPDSDEPEDKSIIYVFECQNTDLEKSVKKTVFDPQKYDEDGKLLEDAPNGPYFVFSATMGFCGEVDGHRIAFGKLLSTRQFARLNDTYNQENKSLLFEKWRQ